MGWFFSKKKKERRESSMTDDYVIKHGNFCPKQLKTRLVLSDFSFTRALGHGYASTVFEAVHSPTKTRCVVKVCMKTRLTHEETRRIRREIENHRTLYHRHILTFFASVEDPSAFYIFLEYAEHGDLFCYIQRHFAGRIPRQRFLFFVLLPLLHAIGHLHSQGIIHRDIKPENILVDSSGCIRLCDFGLSIASYVERPRSVVGTLEYMAPEVLLRGEPPFTDRVDVWAIGVLAYECLVGTSPFSGRNDEEICQKIKRNVVDYDRVVSPEMREFIQSCLQTEPRSRPSVQELLQHPCVHQTIRRSSDGNGTLRRSFSFT